MVHLICSMQKPETAPGSAIPDWVKTKYDEERSKFARYDLDHPEKFITLLRTQLQKKEDPLGYLKKLRMFASRLLLQHLFAQKNAYLSHYTSHKQYLVEAVNKSFAQMGAKKVDERQYQLMDVNDEELAEVLAHSRLLQEELLYSPEDRNVIYGWIIDPSKGEKLRLLGMNRKYTHEGMVAKKEIKEIERDSDEFAKPLMITKFYAIKVPKIIEENTAYLNRLFTNIETFFSKAIKYKKLTHGTKEYEPQSIRKDYDIENAKVADLYTHTHHWYEKLYKIVYQELLNTYKELVQTSPRNTSLVENLQSLPAQSVEDKKIPLFLPKELDAYVDPKTVVKFFNLDDELENARNEFSLKNQPAPQSIAQSPPSKNIPSTSEPRKIMQSSQDGSYILDGQETSTTITIHNPKNKTLEIIFKTDKPSVPQDLPEINYTDWVKMWHQNPAEALEKQGYATFGSQKYEYPENRWKAIARHAFSPLVDNYISKWGTYSTVDSRRVLGKKDILITIPGMLKYPNGTSETGVFTYLIDSTNKQWYHRMFTPQSNRQLIQDLASKGYFSPQMTGYYEVFFPPLPGK